MLFSSDLSHSSPVVVHSHCCVPSDVQIRNVEANKNTRKTKQENKETTTYWQHTLWITVTRTTLQWAKECRNSSVGGALEGPTCMLSVAVFVAQQQHQDLLVNVAGRGPPPPQLPAISWPRYVRPPFMFIARCHGLIVARYLFAPNTEQFAGHTQPLGSSQSPSCRAKTGVSTATGVSHGWNNRPASLSEASSLVKLMVMARSNDFNEQMVSSNVTQTKHWWCQRSDFCDFLLVVWDSNNPM